MQCAWNKKKIQRKQETSFCNLTWYTLPCRQKTKKQKQKNTPPHNGVYYSKKHSNAITQLYLWNNSVEVTSKAFSCSFSYRTWPVGILSMLVCACAGSQFCFETHSIFYLVKGTRSWYLKYRSSHQWNNCFLFDERKPHASFVTDPTTQSRTILWKMWMCS